MINDETPITTGVYTGVGAYPYTFKCYDATELEVTHIDTEGVRTLLTYGVDYTVALTTPSYQGGTVTTTAPTATTGFLEIKSDIAFDQDVDLTAAGSLDLDKLQLIADKMIMRLQLLRMLLDLEYTGRTFTGDWAPYTDYNAGELVIGDVIVGGLYAAKTVHTSGAGFLDDVDAGKWEAVISGDDLIVAAGLPVAGVGDALKAVRVNAGETGYELGHVVPKPTTSIKGMVPVVKVDGSDYEARPNARNPMPRAKFSWVSNTQIKISGWAEYWVEGFGPAVVNSDLTITPTITSPSYWHFYYIKASPTARILTASDIINSTTVPTYDAAKGGWYDGPGNLCVFATWIDGSNNITKFRHFGDRWVHWENSVLLRGYTALGTGWVNVATATSMPPFSFDVLLFFLLGDATNTATYFLRPTGSGATTGHKLGTSIPATSRYVASTIPVGVLSAASGIDIMSDQTTSNAQVYGNAWGLPRGM